MPTPLSNNAFAASVAHNERLNGYQDITWSFQYALCGMPTTQGGFCTFLFDNVTLSGGGLGKSLGYAPSNDYTGFASISGVSGAVFGIGFDTSGLFAVSGNGLETGLTGNTHSAITLRGTNFNYLTSIALSSLDLSFTLLSSTLNYQSLRFRLHSTGRYIEISRLVDYEYVTLLDFPTSLEPTPDTFYKVGVSYAAPLSGISSSAKFAIKNFHVEGSTMIPATASTIEPNIYTFPIVQNLSVESPIPTAINPAVVQFDGPYSPILPPKPVTTECAAQCLDPFVLTLVLDQTPGIGSRAAQFALLTVTEFSQANLLKGVSIITFGDSVCPQVITFDDSIEDAISFLEDAGNGYGAYYCDVGRNAAENGIDALYVAAGINRDYSTEYKKYLYFITDTPDFGSNTYGAFDVNDLLNTYTDGSWLLVGYQSSDDNTQYRDYLPESDIVKYDYFPSCPPAESAYCDSTVRGAGAGGVFSYEFDAGEQTGPYNVSYDGGGEIPVRFSLVWGPFIQSTCFVGDSTYTNALTSMGYAPVRSSTTSGTLSIIKGAEAPNKIKIIVESPIENSQWSFKMRCYGE